MKPSLFLLRSFAVLSLLVGAGSSYAADHDAHDMPAMAAVSKEPPPQLFLDAPVPGLLAKGVVVVKFRTDNLKMSAIQGPGALQVAPRIGHIHITVDQAPWFWAQFDDASIVINQLPSGPHQLTVDLVDPTHHTLLAKKVKLDFVIP